MNSNSRFFGRVPADNTVMLSNMTLQPYLRELRDKTICIEQADTSLMDQSRMLLDINEEPKFEFRTSDQQEEVDPSRLTQIEEHSMDND